MKLFQLVRSDLCRYVGNKNVNFRNFLISYIKDSGFRMIFWIRVYNSNNKILKVLAKFNHFFISRKYHLNIPLNTSIGPGLYLGHGHNIVINPTAIIGKNVNISHYVTIGSNYGLAAEIGDCVYIAPNSCIIENVRVGNDAIIGAGSIVTRDIKACCTVAGSPAKVINNHRHNHLIDNKYITNEG